MAAVGDRLKFESKVTKARTPVSEALALGRGVCQDFAHLFIAACRGLGLPARYVSGYVNHPGEIATHAWCQVWGGDRVGWVDVDPTTREFVADDHVAIAFGRDYSDVPPNRGLWKGRAEETIAVTVKVEPVDRVPMEWNEWSQPAARPGDVPVAEDGRHEPVPADGPLPLPQPAELPRRPPPAAGRAAAASERSSRGSGDAPVRAKDGWTASPRRVVGD